MTQSRNRSNPNPEAEQPTDGNATASRRNQTRENTSGSSSPKRWVDKVSDGLKRFFRTVQDVIRIAGEIFHHAMHTGSFLFGTVFGVSVSPIVQIFVAIAALLLILWITFTQWWDIGVWVARIARIPLSAGGVAGVLFGIGINLKQLAPNSWKLTRALAMVFSSLKVNPNYEPTDPNSPQELRDNWHSANHRSVRIQSNFAFLIECAIVSFYVMAATRLNAYAILQAAIALKLPETTLLWTAHTISLFGEVSNQAVQPEDRQPNHRY